MLAAHNCLRPSNQRPRAHKRHLTHLQRLAVQLAHTLQPPLVLRHLSPRPRLLSALKVLHQTPRPLRPRPQCPRTPTFKNRAPSKSGSRMIQAQASTHQPTQRSSIEDLPTSERLWYNTMSAQLSLKPLERRLRSPLPNTSTPSVIAAIHLISRRPQRPLLLSPPMRALRLRCGVSLRSPKYPLAAHRVAKPLNKQMLLAVQPAKNASRLIGAKRVRPSVLYPALMRAQLFQPQWSVAES